MDRGHNGTMTKRRVVPFLLSLLVATLLAFASAQVDPKARALIEGLQSPTQGEVHNVDQTSVTTIYVDGSEPMETKTRAVIDFDAKRMVSMTDVAGMSTKLIYKDGKVTMSVGGLPMAIPAPPETAAQLEQSFDQAEPIGIKEGDIATYDGQVDYGGLLSGEQVTYTTHDASGEPTTMQFVFVDGKIAGMHMDIEGGQEMLIVYDEPLSMATLAGTSATTYMHENGTWKKFSETNVVEVNFNTTLDESLFD